LDNGDYFGISAADIGELGGDGVPGALVDAIYDDDGGSSRGAMYVLFQSADARPGTHSQTWSLCFCTFCVLQLCR